jgi:hypothetical protein
MCVRACAWQLRCQLREELRPYCERFLDGADILAPDMFPFATFVGGLRLIPTSERPIEAQHAKTHKRGLGRHSHTEQYISYGLRSPELVAQLSAQTSFVKELAYLCKVSLSAYAACQAVGLLMHTSLNLVIGTRAPMYAKVIYHADAMSLYQTALPELQYDSDDDPESGLPTHAGAAAAAPTAAPPPGHAAPTAPAGPQGGSGGGSGGGGGGGHAQASSGVGNSSSSGGRDGGGAGASKAASSSGGGGGGGAASGETSAQGASGSGGSGGAGPGPGREGLGKQNVLARHHGALDLIKKYLVAHLYGRLKHEGGYFCMKVDACAISSLESKLGAASSSVEAAVVDHTSLAVRPDMLASLLDVDNEEVSPEDLVKACRFSSSLRDMIFCRLVRHAPSRMILHPVQGEQGFDKSDTIVSLHAVTKVLPYVGEVLVNIAAVKAPSTNVAQSMVLSLNAFPWPA